MKSPGKNELWRESMGQEYRLRHPGTKQAARRVKNGQRCGQQRGGYLETGSVKAGKEKEVRAFQYSQGTAKITVISGHC